MDKTAGQEFAEVVMGIILLIARGYGFKLFWNIVLVEYTRLASVSLAEAILLFLVLDYVLMPVRTLVPAARGTRGR